MGTVLNQLTGGKHSIKVFNNSALGLNTPPVGTTQFVGCALGEAPLPHSMASIATDRSGRWLFSASYGDDRIAVSPIRADGVARAAHQVLATPPHAHAIRADPSSRFVFATRLGGGLVLQLRFDAASGTLTPNTPSALLPHDAASPRHLGSAAMHASSTC